MSRIIVDSIRNSSASSDALTLSSDGKVAFPNNTGNILQVVTSTKTDSFATTSSSFVDITGMSRTITPSAAGSKILILITLHVGANDSGYPAFALLRGSTIVADGDTDLNNRTACTFGHYLPSQILQIWLHIIS